MYKLPYKSTEYMKTFYYKVKINPFYILSKMIINIKNNYNSVAV